jgi:hypothetical protein
VKSNKKAVNTNRTYEGGMAAPAIKALEQLERQVATCLLFENTFYEKGSDIAQGIAASCDKVGLQGVANMALRARTEFKLRHVPLFLLAQMDRINRANGDGGSIVRETIPQVVQRPDEMAELLAIIKKDRGGKDLKEVISAQVKKGLAATFPKFDAYQLAKWNRDGEVKLRDVLFLSHAKPKDAAQDALWKKLIDGTLEAPDTWEVALSGGKDKKESWERLLAEKKLGYMALLMNLRNMVEAKVDRNLVMPALLEGAPKSRALPFRFVSAAKHAPSYRATLSKAMVSALKNEDELPGMTYILVDVSGSMSSALSAKGTLNRAEAAGALAVLLREIASDARVFSFSNNLVEVSNDHGLGLMDAIIQSQPMGGTALFGALNELKQDYPKPDRVVVVSDEQADSGYNWYTGRTDKMPVCPKSTKGYIINVAPYQPGLDTSGGWVRINGWSERVVEWMRWYERNGVA